MFRSAFTRTALIVSFVAAASSALSQDGVPAYHGSVPGPDAQALSPLDKAVAGSAKRLQGVQVTGDPDYDFVVLLREQHQGAIDIARAYLEHGNNRSLRRMARTLIEERQAQITALNAQEKRLRARLKPRP